MAIKSYILHVFALVGMRAHLAPTYRRIRESTQTDNKVVVSL